MFNFGVALETDMWYTLRINLETALTTEGVTAPFGVYTITDF